MTMKVADGDGGSQTLPAAGKLANAGAWVEA